MDYNMNPITECLVFTIYDRVSKVFSEFPHKGINVEQAKRSFQRFILSSDKDLPVNDLELFCIGIYNRLTGCINAFEKTDFICKGSDFVERIKDA